MAWGSMFIFVAQQTVVGAGDWVLGSAILGGIGAGFTALFAMVRQSLKAGEQREQALLKTIEDQNAWMKETMNATLLTTARASESLAEAIRQNTIVTNRMDEHVIQSINRLDATIKELTREVKSDRRRKVEE